MRVSGWKFRTIGIVATLLILSGLLAGNLPLVMGMVKSEPVVSPVQSPEKSDPVLRLVPLQKALQHLRLDMRDARLSWLSGGWAIADGQLQETRKILAGLLALNWHGDAARMLSLMDQDLQEAGAMLARQPVDLVQMDQMVVRLDQQADWLDKAVFAALSGWQSGRNFQKAQPAAPVPAWMPEWLSPVLILAGLGLALFGMSSLGRHVLAERHIGVGKVRALEDTLKQAQDEGRESRNAAKTSQGVVADLEQKLASLRKEREMLVGERDAIQIRLQQGEMERSLFRGLADIAPGAAFYSPDGEEIRIANPACEILFDGKAPNSLAQILDENGRDRLAAMLIDGEQSLVVKEGVLPLDETGNPLLLVAKPLQNVDGAGLSAHGFVGALLPADNPAEVLARLEQDFALVQEDEARLRDERDQALEDLDVLNRQVAENRDANEAALEAAQRQARIKADLLAMVSHETRTPLTGLKGVVELLLGTRLDERQARYARSASQSIDAALSLLNDMLDLSKMDADRLELSLAPLDLSHLLQEVVAILEPRAVQKGLTLEIVDVPDELWLDGDEGRLRQILLNLVGNAIKFTEHGYVRIGLDGPNEDGALAINVIDTGQGIDAAELPGLFDSFTQTDSGRRSQDAGTGLGLAISQGLAKRMDGEITVNSTRGEGSVFTLNVALQAVSEEDREAAKSRARQAAPQTLSGMRFKRPLKILLAEDNDIVRMVVTEQLESMGHQVVAAETGRLVVVAARDENPDVVLMDVNLPDMNGLDATKAIRDIKGRAGKVPIIALTANALDGDAERCLRAGMDDFLVKPVPVGLLANKLAAWGETADAAHPSETGTSAGNIEPGVDVAVAPPATADIHLEIDMPDTEQAIDHESLDMLMASLGQIRGLTLITDFIREIDTRHRNIHAAVQAGDYKTCESEAHLLKGSAGSMKAGRVFACADAIVEACRGGDSAKVPGTLPLLADVTGELTAELKARLVKSA